MPEYIYTNLPQYVKVNSRTEFSSSVVSSGAVLLASLIQVSFRKSVKFTMNMLLSRQNYIHHPHRKGDISC